MAVLRKTHVSTDALIEAYAEGESLTSLERRFDMCRGGIKKRLIRAGIAIRSDRANRGPRNGKWSENPSPNAGRLRAKIVFPDPEPCSNCATTWMPTRHHIDHNPANNSPSNIAWLCARCHSTHHYLERVKAGTWLW